MAAGPDKAGDGPDGVALGRRAPFASNGQVGARALETQQRILDAARRVFVELGYDAATVEDIAGAAGRSRVAVYQYFDDKDHIFRALTSQLAEQLWTSLEALGPVTPDGAGWRAVRDWMATQSDLHQRYRAVFREFAAAASGDEAFERDAERIRDRQIALFGSKVTDAVVARNRLPTAVRLLLAGSSRTLEIGAVIRTALPSEYARDRLEDALADAVHRSLFGLVDDVNVRPTPADGVPRLDLSPALTEVLDRADAFMEEAGGPRRRVLAALLAVGDDVIAERGRLGLRVEDVVEAAEVSRGAFYRYFDNAEEYVRVIAARALRTSSEAFGEVPDLADASPEDRRDELRRWLRSVTDVHHARRTLLLAGAAGGDGRTLEAATPGSYDWGRRRMARALQARSFGGDIDVEALILLGMIEGFGAQARSSHELDVMVDIVDVGFLGALDS